MDEHDQAVALIKQQHRLAIEAAELWGDKRPRRWLAKFGQLLHMSDTGSNELRKEYNKHLRQISLLIPPPIKEK